MRIFGALLASLALLGATASAFDFTLEDEYTFEDYLADFPDKSYADAAERALREAVFAKRLAAIQHHNTHLAGKSKGYRKGVNQFTDRTDEELQALLGFKPDRAKLLAKSSSNALPAFFAQGDEAATSMLRARKERRRGMTVLPDSVDWRQADPPVLTAPKDQGACGSCWTFSGTEAIESALAVATKQLYTLSEQVYVSCTANPSHCGGRGGCTGGTQDLLFEYAMEHGFYLEESVPYISGNGTEPACPRLDKADGPLGAIKGYVDVASNDAEAHMVALQAQPLAISLDASEFHAYHSGVLEFEDCGSDLNHAVLLVGYGTDDETGADYWIVRNSWGDSWGEGGYIRLARSNRCALDTRPQDGVGCDGENTPVVVCGTCGMLTYTSYPVGAFLY